jgi:predicted nucleotidyltransferase
VRSAIPENIDKAVAGLSLPERFSFAISQYASKIAEVLKPDCIILYGSLAKDTYTTASDIDLVVISYHLPEHFFDRLRVLQELNNTPCPIDAFGYTTEEFQNMLEQGHVTALDALADGVPLHGRDYFHQMREIFQEMVNRGLRRSSCTWVLPNVSAPNS